MSRLKQLYKEKVKQGLQQKFGYENPMQIPSLKKIVINMGLAEASKDKNTLQQAENELMVIAGQKPVKTKSKKAISNFKLREGQVIGMKATLRGKRMFDFLDRFINIVAPRIRDFRGFEPKCDGRGNYSVTPGIDDQQIFPEVNLDEVKRTQGMHITFVTSAHTDPECIELLRLLGVPFKNHPIVANA